VRRLGQDYAWSDSGTFESLQDATDFLAVLEKRQRQKIACPERIAYFSGWIEPDEIAEAASKLNNSGDGDYLTSLRARRLY